MPSVAAVAGPFATCNKPTPPRFPAQNANSLAVYPRSWEGAAATVVICILGGFHLDPNPDADPEAPWYARHRKSDVKKYDREIVAAADRYQVDADLVRAIMYVETTRGYYDFLAESVGMNSSLLPMNIDRDAWGDFFGTREELKIPQKNIMDGAKLIKAIAQNFDDTPSISEIASLYNTFRTTIVTNYGASAAKVYRERKWEK